MAGVFRRTQAPAIAGKPNEDWRGAFWPCWKETLLVCGRWPVKPPQSVSGRVETVPTADKSRALQLAELFLRVVRRHEERKRKEMERRDHAA